jgi:hypothetical protein
LQTTPKYAEINDNRDVEKLQHALDLLVKWAELWQLKIATNKCFTMNVDKIPSRVLSSGIDYRIDDCILPSLASCRDLGIIVSSDLSNREHVNAIALKAHQRANMILKCFVCKDIKVLLRAYHAYVRPILEYNSVVWSPILKCEIDALERVQRRFTKRLRGMNLLSYSDRLIRLDLTTLELRRLHNDLIMCYKIVFGLIDLKFTDFFTFSPSGVTRGHEFKLYKTRAEGTRNTFFTTRVINVWNALSPDTVDFNSLRTFKHTITSSDFSPFLKASMY